MPASKLASPLLVSDDHPAHALKIGREEEQQSLMKLTPISLPNDNIVDNLRKQYPDDQRWTLFRNDFKYIYVMQWMFQCRGYLKLILEYFDPDLFEIELFNLVDPPPVNESSLLSNKVRLGLLNKLFDRKITNLEDFEFNFRKKFGYETPLKGADVSVDETEHDLSLPTFDDLFIDEKFHVLYLLMAEVSSKNEFRDFMDKNDISPDFLRPEYIYESLDKTTGKSEDYCIVFDGSALYRRLVTFAQLNVAKKRKLAPSNPAAVFDDSAFGEVDISYDIVFRNVYELNQFISDLKTRRKVKKNKQILDVINDEDFISNVFNCEFKKRRILQNRRKESRMAHLLATRKKSLRLEAKERERDQEEQERRLREIELSGRASNRRSARNRNNMETKLKQDFTAGLTREERLKLRKRASLTDDEQNGSVTPDMDVKEEYAEDNERDESPQDP